MERRGSPGLVFPAAAAGPPEVVAAAPEAVRACCCPGPAEKLASGSSPTCTPRRTRRLEAIALTVRLSLHCTNIIPVPTRAGLSTFAAKVVIKHRLTAPNWDV